MSCYQVHSHHINTLVSYGQARRVSAYIPAGYADGQHIAFDVALDLIARILTRANAAAVAQRYSEPELAELPRFERVRELHRLARAAGMHKRVQHPGIRSNRGIA